MLKKCFKILLIILITTLLMVNIVKGEEVKEITPKRAIVMVVENNLDIEIANINLDNAYIAYEKNKALILQAQSRYQEKQAELALAQAENNYLQTKNGLFINIINKYLQVAQEELDLQIKEKNEVLAARKLMEVKNQVEAGHRGSFDLLQQENEYNNVVFNKEKALTDYQLLLREFKRELGLNQEKQIKLIVLKEPEMYALSEEEILVLAKENSFELELKKRQLELAEIDLERAKVSDTSFLELKERENQVKIASLNKQKVAKELAHSVQEQYYSLVQAYKNIELAGKNVEQALENQRIIKSQKQAGLRTENDLLTSKLNLLQAQYNRQVSLANYYLSLLNIQQLMGLEIGGAVDELLPTD